MRQDEHQRMSPVSCARCMRTTLASASDASLRRWASPVDQQGLWRFEPQPDERHRCGRRHVFNDLSVCRPRIDRIDDDAVACTEDECGLFCQGGVDALGHVRRVSFRTEALQEREHRTDASASRRCATPPHPGRRRPTVQDRAPVSTSPSPRNLQPRRGTDAADAVVVRPWRDTRAPFPRAHCGVARRAEVVLPSRSSWREQPPCRTETAAGERRRRSLPSRPGNGSTRCWHGAAVFAATDPSGETRDRRRRPCRKSRR